MMDYNEKMCQFRERTSYDSKSSFDSASSDDEKELLPPYGLVFYSRRLQNKPLPVLPSQGRRVRFALEKPLPPLPGQSKAKRVMSRVSTGEQAWWAQSWFNLSDDLEDSMEKKIH